MAKDMKHSLQQPYNKAITGLKGIQISCDIYCKAESSGQSIILLLLPVMLCCSALKVYLLC